MIKLRINDILWEKRLTQADLSRLSGISRAQICRYNKADTGLRMSNIDRLCRALEVTPGELFEFVPDKTTEVI